MLWRHCRSHRLQIGNGDFTNSISHGCERQTANVKSVRRLHTLCIWPTYTVYVAYVHSVFCPNTLFTFAVRLSLPAFVRLCFIMFIMICFFVLFFNALGFIP